MADEEFNLFPTLTDLLKPLPVIPGTHGEGEVAERHRQKLVGQLNLAGAYLTMLADNVERDPDSDGLYNRIAQDANQAICNADLAMYAFRQTRDCLGEG